MDRPVPPHLADLADSFVEKCPDHMRDVARRLLEAMYQVGFMEGRVSTDPILSDEVAKCWREWMERRG